MASMGTICEWKVFWHTYKVYADRVEHYVTAQQKKAWSIPVDSIESMRMEDEKLVLALKDGKQAKVSGSRKMLEEAKADIQALRPVYGPMSVH